MSVFLTPKLEPFWGGTYFPPRSRYGRPGFGDLLLQLTQAYTRERSKVESAAAELTRHLVAATRSEAAAPGDAGEAGLPGEGLLDRALEHDRASFDPVHGGFGSAPKFPRAVELSLLLRQWARCRDADLLEICERTLDAMARGGIHDQIGGGFHRYSTDERWLVPHFEKMLYDNALLARAYTEAWQATGEARHAATARSTLDYLLREMTGPEGGFYSATDADSDGEEGKFFLWKPEEVERVLGRERARVVCEYFDITLGGNFEGAGSIPNTPRSAETVGRALGLDAARVLAVVEESRPLLRAARDGRPRPFLDEKVIVAWNGLAISALARAGAAFGEPRYVEAAARCARFIEGTLRPAGRLHRIFMRGRVQGLAYLDDHAALAEGLLDLHEATFDGSFLEAAGGIVDGALERFRDTEGGGFFFTEPEHETPLARRKEMIDGATPSSNGQACRVLLRLERHTGRTACRDRAEALLRGVNPEMERYPMAFGTTLSALDWFLGPTVEIAIVGDPGHPGFEALKLAARSVYLPSLAISGTWKPILETWKPIPGKEASPSALLEGKTAAGGRPAAYVCEGARCLAPVVEPGALVTLLRGLRRQAPARPGLRREAGPSAPDGSA
jgi:uncharacterized protein YyaL (SSP411 family)